MIDILHKQLFVSLLKYWILYVRRKNISEPVMLDGSPLHITELIVYL